MEFDPEQYLKALAAMPDEQIDLGRAALALAETERKGRIAGRYLHHLEQIAQAVAQRHAGLMASGRADDCHARREALSSVIAEEFGYEGDKHTYDDLRNANLMDVIDRQRGLPVALGILYLRAAQVQGWCTEGLRLPGHFICRLEQGGGRVMFDPFEGGREILTHDARNLLKKTQGPQAELSADYFQPVTRRDVLMRLQNNIKHRQIEMEDYEAALRTVEIMRAINPDEPRLLLDAGVLYARTSRNKFAIEALEAYIARAPREIDRQEAILLLRDIKSILN